MKNILKVFLLIPLSALGQKDSLEKGFEFNALVANNGYHLTFNPNFFVKKGKHVLGTGPVFTMLPNAYTEGENRTKFTGYRLFYKLRPNPEGKRFSFYFRYDFILQTYKTLFYTYTFKDNRIENYLGYGFNLKLWKNLFITQHLGLGAHYMIRKYSGPTGTISLTKDWEEGAIGGIGIGYAFGRQGR